MIKIVLRTGYMGTKSPNPIFEKIYQMHLVWVHEYMGTNEFKRASKFWGMIKIVLRTGYMGTKFSNPIFEKMYLMDLVYAREYMGTKSSNPSFNSNLPDTFGLGT